jgi:hypothetical protein
VASKRVAIAWQDEMPGMPEDTLRIHIRTSADRGLTWSYEQNLSPETEHNVDPDVIVTNENVHVGWAGNSPPNDLDVFYRRGRIITTGVRASGLVVPGHVQLMQNYPNPFNSQTDIRFGVGQTSAIEIDVVNLLGQNVRTLGAGQYHPGWHTVQWDGKNERGSDLPSGLYFVRLLDQENIMVRKAILLR